MIITITPNPAVDRTLTVSHVDAGAIHRATHSMVAAGGKGLNVARAVKQLGGDVMGTGLVGGHSGRWIAQLTEAEGITGAWTWIEAESRTCTMVVSAGADATVFNESGPTLAKDDWSRFIEDVSRLATAETVFCLCGSLPHGTPRRAPADLIERLQAAGQSVWVDTSGEPLRVALTARPYGLKINGQEAGDLLGMVIHSPTDAVAAATRLREEGIEQVVITLGAAGAVWVNGAGAIHAAPPMLSIVSSVGSGDAFFGGLLTAWMAGQVPSDGLRIAVAAGSANAMAIGGGEVKQGLFQEILGQVQIRKIEA